MKDDFIRVGQVGLHGHVLVLSLLLLLALYFLFQSQGKPQLIPSNFVLTFSSLSFPGTSMRASLNDVDDFIEIPCEVKSLLIPLKAWRRFKRIKQPDLVG